MGDAAPARRDRLAPLVVVACVAGLALLGLLGGALTVADRLWSLAPPLGAAFYALVLILMVVGVVLPLVQVLVRPVFSLYRLRDERGHARMWWCRRLASNLRANVELTPVQRARLDDALTPGAPADEMLIALVREACEPRVDARIRSAALRAFSATAVSQTAAYDTLSMLVINFELVRAIVSELGFRPSNVALARLYLRVLGGAFLAGGMEELDLEEVMPAMIGQAKVPGVVLASAAQGAVNAFTTYRVGVICKRWLMSEDGPARMGELRRSSYREALAMMRTGGFFSQAAGVVARRVDAVRAGAWAQVKEAAGDTWVGRRIWRRDERDAPGNAPNVEKL